VCTAFGASANYLILINNLEGLHIESAFLVARSFVTPLRKAKFCGVPSEAIVRVGCAVDKKRLRYTALLLVNNIRKVDELVLSRTCFKEKKLLSDI
jgi:predicted RNase H-like nuclease